MIEEIDPITLEPISHSKRVLIFQYGNSKTKYDFDFFYNNIEKIKIIPHTGQEFTEGQKCQFDDLCRSFNLPPVFNKYTVVNRLNDAFAFVIGSILICLICLIVITLTKLLLVCF